ncbi:MAG TPA: gliding motility-associated ABC transporter substrate-binding protein GldG, partial [Bacteroidales bacterium]|nr:gliding motility-associated ABC transporter substrate-binding protein GldG [Bacteroidales bacterium]
MWNRFSKQKKSSIIQLMAGIIIIIAVNTISSFLFTRLDLTSENRYSLSDATKEMLNKVDDIVFFKVYLDGDFPAGFKKLKRETREMLDEFRAYNKNIQYEFINPADVGSQEERNKLYRELMRKGLNPTELRVSEKEGASQKIIFPGTIVTYLDREVSAHLLVSQKGQPPEQALNKSVQNLEYNIGNAIQKLISGEQKSVAFVTSNGELPKKRTLDIETALKEYYNVDRVRIDGKLHALTERKEIDSVDFVVTPKYDVLIFAKPDSAINDKDKFIIDQYLMHGGKIVWLVDPVHASMDSLRNKARTIGLARDLGLRNMFFNYGFRVNTNLVMDLNSGAIPIVTGNVGGEPQYEFLPWLYFPVLIPESDHPIVATLNNVRTEFVSSIDTIKTPRIKKTTLLTTSAYSRTINAPAPISLESARDKPNPENYQEPPQTVGLLLEGRFRSFYDNRMPPSIIDSKMIDFKKRSKETQMVIFSDGDIIKNQLHYSRGYPLPLGYDQFTGQTFGNKDLILNTVNYLTNDQGILSARAKDFKVRLMDQTKIEDHRIIIQLITTLLPVLLVIIAG